MEDLSNPPKSLNVTWTVHNARSITNRLKQESTLQLSRFSTEVTQYYLRPSPSVSTDTLGSPLGHPVNLVIYDIYHIYIVYIS